MRRRFPLSLLFATVLLLPAPGRGDTIILKSGEKLEGKVVGESPTDYTVEYKVSAGITDSRKLLKSEVEKIEKETPDEPIWQQLKTTKPGSSSLPSSSYDAPMKSLQYFLTQFPQSTHAGEAAQALLAFEADKKRVDAGEVKIDDRWLPKEEVEKERYQINGRAIFAHMQDLARRADLVGAMTAFDTLEKKFPGAAVFPDAVEFAKTIVPKLKQTAEVTLKNWQVARAERDAATKNMPDAQRVQTAEAQKREQQALDLAFDAATKSGTKWPPFQKQHERTLTTLVSKAQAEITRLDTLPVAKMRESLKLTQQARTQWASGSTETAEPAVKEATKLWSANEIATRLQKEIGAQKALAKAATPVPVVVATPVPRATPVPTVAKSTPTPIPAVVEPPKNFFTTPRGYGVIGLVVFALGAGYFKYKKKQETAGSDPE